MRKLPPEHMHTELCMGGRLKHGFHTRPKILAVASGGNQISGCVKKSAVHQWCKREVLSHAAGVWITFLIGSVYEHHCSQEMSSFNHFRCVFLAADA